MDNKTFIVEFVKAAAWPALAGFALYQYRNYLKRVMLVLARSMRRMDSLKFAGVEMARSALEPAVESAEIRVENAKDELTGSDTQDPEERQALVERLAAAAAELESLRLAHAQLQQERGSRRAEEADAVPLKYRFVARGLCSFALQRAQEQGLSLEDLMQLSPNEIDQLFLDVLTSPQKYTLPSRSRLTEMINHGYFSPAMRPTPKLRHLFKLIANNRGASGLGPQEAIK
ncbi:MAG: hypothetical protein WA955_15665 [Diaphorobacter nitroreducens]|uniref:hypothetical protein n=1 Tax=Diaphorobacter nitroreducens TaxID=164759 RepID=UPI003C708279